MRSYSGVSCCSTRKRRDLEQEIQQLEKEKLVLAEVAQPKPKDTRKAVDLEEGNYFCKTYATRCGCVQPQAGSALTKCYGAI